MFQQFTNLQATKAQTLIITCEKGINKEYKNQYQRVAGFLPVDRLVAWEEIDMVKKVEIAEMDLFVGLYQIDAATDSDNACTDNESDADLDVDEPERL